MGFEAQMLSLCGGGDKTTTPPRRLFKSSLFNNFIVEITVIIEIFVIIEILVFTQILHFEIISTHRFFFKPIFRIRWFQPLSQPPPMAV